MGAIGVRVKSIGDLEAAIQDARKADRTTVIHIDVHPTDWTGENHSWWECGTPEISTRATVQAARAEHEAGKARQRLGV
jgi:3D-(3,5/4)-trihydroxycyclohexane-1,2-dione acylhydrolase (decyclizing)